MKKFSVILLLALLLGTWSTQAQTHVKREQRGVWMSAYVSDWPGGAITESNAAAMKRACQKMLDTLAVNNMNAIYFHVRAMCDALYESSYEPWSNLVGGQRGHAPAFDPFAYLIDEGHKRGIEIYAWVNPYRYASKSAGLWGQSELDYVHTHPEWLLQDDYETVLNPGIPEVRQRIVDVCKDIIVKYDCDGLVFDDYFYNQDGASFDLDSALYNAYRRDGGTMSQGDWRRENVNMMVHDVNQMVKLTKPWVRFGIGPAGVACSSPTVAAQYGVDPSPGSDWQYNQIYSDPMAWISRGDIDFMAPQVYWNTKGTYTPVTTWWGKIGQKFNRHVYISGYAVDRIVDGSDWNLDEYLLQVRVMRDAMLSGNYGMVYFKYSTWRNLSGNLNGKTKQLRHFLKDSVYTTPSLSPSVAWMRPAQTYGTVTGLERVADSLVWDAVDNVRYVVYAIPDSVDIATFNCQPQYILGVRYAPVYSLPDAYKEGYDFAVTILDRWENEYAPLQVGATPHQAPKPVLLAPAAGETTAELNYLQWTCGESAGPLNYTLQVYRDADLADMVACVQLDSARYAIASVPGLEEGTYYWQVTACGLNQSPAASDVGSFTYEHMRVTSPADGTSGLSLTPTFTCTQASPGTNYFLEFSTVSSFTTIAYTATSNAPIFEIPAFKLMGGCTYYVRVRARLGDAEVTSNAIRVQTADVIPTVPVYVVPETDNATLTNRSKIQFEPQQGTQSLRVEISSNPSFPVRTSYRGTITDETFATPPLGTITGVGRMIDGKTYYVRGRYAYYTIATGNVVQYTDYSPVRQFLYQELPPGDVTGDGSVNVTDVTALVNMILGVIPMDEPAADVDGNGAVNVSDVTALINHILGIS